MKSAELLTELSVRIMAASGLEAEFAGQTLRAATTVDYVGAFIYEQHAAGNRQVVHALRLVAQWVTEQPDS